MQVIETAQEKQTKQVFRREQIHGRDLLVYGFQLSVEEEDPAEAAKKFQQMLARYEKQQKDLHDPACQFEQAAARWEISQRNNTSEGTQDASHAIEKMRDAQRKFQLLKHQISDPKLLELLDGMVVDLIHSAHSALDAVQVKFESKIFEGTKNEQNRRKKLLEQKIEQLKWFKLYEKLLLTSTMTHKQRLNCIRKEFAPIETQEDNENQEGWTSLRRMQNLIAADPTKRNQQKQKLMDSAKKLVQKLPPVIIQQLDLSLTD